MIEIRSKIYEHKRQEYTYSPNDNGLGGNFTESNAKSTVEYFVLVVDNVELSGVWTTRESLKSDLKRLGIKYDSRDDNCHSEK